MAEALIAVLIENLASMTFHQIGEEVTLVKDVKDNVLALKSNLESIQAMLEDAERKQLSDVAVRLWLNKLKSLSHDMDHVLDEWNTALLRVRNGGGQQVEDDDHTKEKVCLSFALPFSCFKSKVEKITLRRDIGHKIKDLNEKLDLIVREKERYKLTTITVDQPVERPRTTSFVNEIETYGRDHDKEVVVNRLLSDGNSGGFEIIPIIGMGGLGKTTLAQLAFNNQSVRAQFDERIWVCVSDPFDVMKVARAIVEAIEGIAPNINELETLLQHLCKCIEGKRFLLVLDDLWTKDNKKWDQLKQPLRSGANGSKIIVTTRKQEVVIMMGVANCAIRLEKLSDKDCWLIFKRLAFLERSKEEQNELEEIGREITKKCKGLPLVAKILGGLMCFKRTKAQWEDVLHSKLWKLKDAKEEIFAPFLLSYYDLSATEKRCFSYCAVFPKDHQIGIDQLIDMWMSQNYLSHDSNPQEVGRECFENLAMRSFFQNFEKFGYDDSVTHCRMHDIVHDFAQFLTENECITMEFDNVQEIVLKPLNERARHLTIMSECRITALLVDNISNTNKRNLRTLFATVEPVRRHTLDYSSLFLHLTCLRSLTLSGCRVNQLPVNIGRLIYLRYLDLSHNSFNQLPETLSDLCNLRSLNLLKCHCLQSLPESIGRLVNLRHLYIGHENEIGGFPKSFRELSCLRSIDVLILGRSNESDFSIADFEKLRNLRLKSSFYIRECRNLQSQCGAEKVGLKHSAQVDNLFLEFAWSYNNLGIDQDDAILEGLEPHRNLQSLTIRNYSGATLSPRWMTVLVRLRRIELSYCEMCEMLPSLGRLPSLESIRLNRLERVKNVGLEFLGITDSNEGGLTNTIILFPKLKELRFACMDKWEKWQGSEASTSTSLIRIMPCLTLLELAWCPHLQQVPDFLKMNTSLQELTIRSSEIIGKWCKEKTGKEWDKISHIPNIKLEEVYIRRDGEWIDQ